MEKAVFTRIMLAAALVFILVFAAACSCGKDSEFVDVLLEQTSPSDTVSETDTEEVTETDIISETDLSGTDISESTQVSESDIASASDAITEQTTATKVSSTQSGNSSSEGNSADDGYNAAGVYKPNYKTKYYIVVHTGSQSVAIYGKDDNGYYTKLVNCFTCSTGCAGHETRTGIYTIWRKFRWRALVGGVYGQYNSSISKDYLFHSVPYRRQSIDTLQNEEYDKLGTPASHGCIRLCVRDAKWIYDNCDIDTQVNIINTSGPAGAGVPARNTDPAYKGWDPTDKWAKHNPYFYSPSTAATTTTTAAPTTTTTTATTTTATTTSSTEATTMTTVETTTTTTTTTTTAETSTSESGSNE